MAKQEHRTRFTDKRYVALLKHRGRSTAKQLNVFTNECELVTRRKLSDLRKRGVIYGVLVGRTLEFWTK